MNYEQTLNYLFTRLPMFSRIGSAAFKKDLTNTLRLCEELGNPQNKFRSIHIAGTNGKGSVSHMTAGILQTSGYKTGLYTSPHLKDFRERIKVDGMFCNEEFVVDFVKKIKPMIEDLEPSFFEITVAMAFEYFAQERVDVAVVEVGLGGRLDSTNIITPELCIVTNIGWDHMDMLGDSLQKIAMEKAGIFKKNVPVVIGESIPATKRVFEHCAREVKTSVVYAHEKRWIPEWRHEKEQLVVTVADHHSDERTTYSLDLAGIYQTNNLLTVLEGIHTLRAGKWNIDSGSIKEGLAHAKKLTGLHGRWETVHHSPAIILDVAHNEDGIRQLIKQIEISDYHHLHIVIGMVKDKDTRKVLCQFPSYAHYYFTRADIPRALDEAELAAQALKFNLKGHHFREVNLALQSAITHAHTNDLILVCGSVFVVGEVDISRMKF